MKYGRISFFFITVFTALLGFCSCVSRHSPMTEETPLPNHWFFKSADGNEWMTASVPGTVHTDLLRNGQIEDPFFGCNEEALQWIGRKDWIYKTQFDVPASVLCRRHIFLVFEGLDTYAEITLNGQLLGRTDNMFRRWEFDVTNCLRRENNLLEIVFFSAEAKTTNDSAASKLIFPGGKRVFARKAGYHFGWDWGPKFITAGIWKPVYLASWDNHKINNINLKTKSLDSHQATIEAIIDITSLRQENANLRIYCAETNGLYLDTQLDLDPKKKKHQVSFTIKNPELWWCNSLGEPHLYNLSVEIVTASREKDIQSLSYGIRTLEIVSEPDSIGHSFYVKLNGIPVFLKGADYIPQHSFLTEVDEKKYQHIVSLAKESNMNMLRVWGGGIYENDIFYELCDKNGIMVWQDFMFACAMYPFDTVFTENVRVEADQQIVRLRNHASLALWCGNNEIDEGWHNWGWQRRFNISKTDSATIWNGYKAVFREMLPQLVQKHDSGRFYVSTSPQYGWGRRQSITHGTAHYWGVWWGLEPFTKYLEKIPRFMSEFGFQAMPAKSTIRSFQPASDDSLFSASLICHQKHPTGYQTIATYLEREHLYPETIDDFIYMSQLIQAEGIGMAVEAHRRAKPRCMGTLYWQLNDCWPVTSWSGTDFFGNRKMLQYKIKNLYDDILVSLLLDGDTVNCYLVSDILADMEGRLEISAVGFFGEKQIIYSAKEILPANQSKHVFSVASKALFAAYNPDTTLFEASFTTLSNKTYRNRKFFAPLGKINLPKAELDVKIKCHQQTSTITLKANNLTAYVHLSLGEKHARFSDNHFILLPLEEKTVECVSNEPFDFNELIITTLNLKNTSP